jgi:hypothetical protein
MSRKLDAIFDAVDGLLLAGEYELVDAMLKGSDPEKMEVVRIISLLSLTRPAENKLPSRDEFFKKSWEVIEKRGRDVKKLLGGLEHWGTMDLAR